MKNATVKLHATGKRWYVSYYVTNVEGRRERRRDYGYINAEKDLAKRMQLLIELQSKTYYAIEHQSETRGIQLNQSITIYKCINQVIYDKKVYLKETSVLAIEKNLRKFKTWLLETNLATKHPGEITKVQIINYRNWLCQSGISNRTVNNAFEEARCFFNHLVDKTDLIYKNPCNNIPDLPSRSESHVAFTDEEAKKMGDYLREHDPWLLFYIKFVAYSFFRTSEARQIQIKDIDLQNRRILMPASNNKNSKRIAKIIPDIFIEEFEKRNLSQYPRNYYLFGINNRPGKTYVNKQYFTSRFKLVKNKFGLSRLHTLYGFRHTFVSQLLRSGKPWHQIMALTGHTTMSSFEKYVRSIMALPAKDLSDGFTVVL